MKKTSSIRTVCSLLSSIFSLIFQILPLPDVEDFLLVYRTFITSATIVFERMIKWFDDPAQRDRVARLVLLWVNNHFNDFETDARMGELMDKFETALQAEVR